MKIGNGSALVGCIQMIVTQYMLVVVGKAKTYNIWLININVKIIIISLFRYIIPGTFIPCLYVSALRINQIIYEDIFVTGIIAQDCGFQASTYIPT